MRLAPLAVLCLSVVTSGRTFAQRLEDPFAGFHARQIPRDTALVRQASEAARLVDKGFDSTVVVRTLGGRRMVFLRGWTGGGTGYQQVGILVFVAAGPDSVRRVWWGIADEHVHVGSYTGMEHPPEWDIHGCLYVYGSRLVYVRSRPAPPGRGGETPPVSPAGTYAWSERVGGFTRVGPAPAAAWPRCRRSRDTTEP